MSSGPMVPDLNWGDAAQKFREETGPQILLCATCARQGVFDPPNRVIVWGGYSYCLPHIAAALANALEVVS